MIIFIRATRHSLSVRGEHSGAENMNMRGFLRLFSTLFLLLALFTASDIGPVAIAEARTCESQSHRFKGPCVRASNCAAVCQTEGFHGGQCRGFRRRCFCTKHC